jgi:hypothetical protein
LLNWRRGPRRRLRYRRSWESCRRVRCGETIEWRCRRHSRRTGRASRCNAWRTRFVLLLGRILVGSRLYGRRRKQCGARRCRSTHAWRAMCRSRDRSKLLLRRTVDTYENDSAADRAPRSNTADRNLGRINAKYGSTLGTRNVHVLFLPLRARMAASLSLSIEHGSRWSNERNRINGSRESASLDLDANIGRGSSEVKAAARSTRRDTV